MADIFHEPDYTANIKVERLLNAAILGASIQGGFEEYLEILDGFYAEDIEASSEGCEGTVAGKAALRSRVTAFVAPLHVFAEIGGLIVSLHCEPIPSDGHDETHSLWTLEMTGVTGRRCVMKWHSCRQWREGRVIREGHSEIEQTGGPLTADDLDMHPRAGSGAGFIH